MLNIKQLKTNIETFTLIDNRYTPD